MFFTISKPIVLKSIHILLTTDQEVRGSSPFGRAKLFNVLA